MCNSVRVCEKINHYILYIYNTVLIILCMKIMNMINHLKEKKKKKSGRMTFENGRLCPHLKPNLLACVNNFKLESTLQYYDCIGD